MPRVVNIKSKESVQMFKVNPSLPKLPALTSSYLFQNLSAPLFSKVSGLSVGPVSHAADSSPSSCALAKAKKSEPSLFSNVPSFNHRLTTNAGNDPNSLLKSMLTAPINKK